MWLGSCRLFSTLFVASQCSEIARRARVAFLLAAFGLFATPARAQECSSLWSAEGRLERREELVAQCNRSNWTALLPSLTELARRGDWQASFLWYFRHRFADIRKTIELHGDVSESLDRDPTDGVACRPLLDVLSGSLADPGALRRIRALGAADKCFAKGSKGGAPAASNYYVTLAAAKGDQAAILLDGEPYPKQLRGVTVPNAPAGVQVFLAAVPAQTGAVLLLEPASVATATRPFVFRVEPNATPALADRYIDSISSRRTLTLTLELDWMRSLQAPYLNGRRLEIQASDSARKVARVLLNGRTESNALVVVDMPKESEKKSEKPKAQFRDLIPHQASPFSYQLNLGEYAQMVGILPIVPEACHEHGIDESSVRRRITEFLRAHGVMVGELGLLADVARKYTAVVTSITEMPGSSTTLSRHSAGNSETFGREAKTLLAQGFANLLDFRVSCTRSASGKPLFGFTAVRVYLDRITVEDAEPFEYRNDPNQRLFESSSHIVNDPLMLRDGAVRPVAQLWRESYVEIVDRASPVWLHEGIRLRFSSLSAKVTGWIQKLPENGSDPCAQYRAANELQDPAMPRTKWARLETVKDTEATFEPGWLAGSGHYLAVLIAGDSERQTKPTPNAADWFPRSSFHCIRVAEPWLETGADYYFGGIGRLQAEQVNARTEKRFDRFVLARIGTASGFAVNAGYWQARREGSTPSSWADTPRLGDVRVDGKIPYVYNSQALLFGVSYGGRLCLQCFTPWGHRIWHRHFPIELHGHLLARFEWGSRAQLPPELKDFAEETSGGRSTSLDVTAGLALSIGFQLSNNVLIRPLNFSAFVPRVGHALSFANPFIDDTAKRSVWWDPTVVLFTYGIGGAYQWD